MKKAIIVLAVMMAAAGQWAVGGTVLFSGDEDSLSLGTLGVAGTQTPTSAGYWEVETKFGNVDSEVVDFGGSHGQVILLRDDDTDNQRQPRLRAYLSTTTTSDITVSYDMRFSASGFASANDFAANILMNASDGTSWSFIRIRDSDGGRRLTLVEFQFGNNDVATGELDEWYNVKQEHFFDSLQYYLTVTKESTGEVIFQDLCLRGHAGVPTEFAFLRFIEGKQDQRTLHHYIDNVKIEAGAVVKGHAPGPWYHDGFERVITNNRAWQAVELGGDHSAFVNEPSPGGYFFGDRYDTESHNIGVNAQAGSTAVSNRVNDLKTDGDGTIRSNFVWGPSTITSSNVYDGTQALRLASRSHDDDDGQGGTTDHGTGGDFDGFMDANPTLNNRQPEWMDQQDERWTSTMVDAVSIRTVIGPHVTAGDTDNGVVHTGFAFNVDAGADGLAGGPGPMTTQLSVGIGDTASGTNSHENADNISWIRLKNFDGTLMMGVVNAGGTEITGPTDVTANEWHTVIWEIDLTNSMILNVYFDGAPVAVWTNLAFADNGSPSIDGFRINASSPNRGTNILLDDLFIANCDITVLVDSLCDELASSPPTSLDELTALATQLANDFNLPQPCVDLFLTTTGL